MMYIAAALQRGTDEFPWAAEELARSRDPSSARSRVIWASGRLDSAWLLGSGSRWPEIV
jgi:hypothetical protein